jgi:chromosome segregation ATPase
MAKMARKEQILVSELSDDSPERETVTTRILTRSKETITKLTKVMTTLTEKQTTITEKLTSFKSDITDLTEKMSKIVAKITSLQETLKLKLAERKSKREILKSYTMKGDTKVTSTESSIVTQTKIDEMTEKIKETRKTIKAQIQSKNEYFATKVTTQKQVDLFSSRSKIIDTQVTNIK